MPNRPAIKVACPRMSADIPNLPFQDHRHHLVVGTRHSSSPPSPAILYVMTDRGTATGQKRPASTSDPTPLRTSSRASGDVAAASAENVPGNPRRQVTGVPSK